MKLARKVKVGTLALIFAGALCGCNQDQNPSQTPAAAPSSPAAGDLKTMIPDTNRPAICRRCRRYPRCQPCPSRPWLLICRRCRPCPPCPSRPRLLICRRPRCQRCPRPRVINSAQARQETGRGTPDSGLASLRLGTRDTGLGTCFFRLRTRDLLS